jgi:selenocysteine insertion sequence-binding protein 2
VSFSFSGGLDDALNNILTLCNEQNVPFVFALGRRALGRACAKLVPVSVVGIFNFSGSEVSMKHELQLLVIFILRFSPR